MARFCFGRLSNYNHSGSLVKWAGSCSCAGSISNTKESKEPWAEVSDKLAQATAMYYKASPLASDSEPNHFYLAYLYSTAAIRQASLFFSIWSAKGWGPLAFTTMLQPGANPYLPPTLSNPEHNTSLNLERLSMVSGISRSTISGYLAQAHGPWLVHLGPTERLAVLETMAGMYACLGYKRKEAYVLREVLGCVMDLLVCGREENRKPTTSPGGAGLGIRNASFGGGNGVPGTVGVRQNESAEGNASILRLLKYVCKVLGIDLEAVKLVNPAELSAEDNKAETNNSSQDDTLDTLPEVYGWPELQIGVIREAIAVAESLPDYLTVAQIAASSLKTMHPVLAAADQQHLYATSGRALTTAQRRGETTQIEYWAGQPVISVAISPLPFIRLPIEKPMSILKTHRTTTNPILTGATDPFLYNPRKSLLVKGKGLIIQNEPLELLVTLHNPFVFDLELQALSISTSGVPFDSKSVAVVLPARIPDAPNVPHTVTLIGRPLQTGTLVIRGCTIQAPGGTPREFILPLATDEEEEKSSRKRSALECEIDRSKYSGLDSRPWAKNSKRLSIKVQPKVPQAFLECKVVPEQPLLRIRRTSLTHGAVMLYNGEMSTIRLTMENVSALPIDFLRLSFDDSTMAPAQLALAEGELSVFDTYETEYDLIHKPAFTWQNQKESKNIGAGQKVILTVSCFGKVGCTNGTIHVAYSYVHRPLAESADEPDVFHTRQLTYPVLVTVYHMLECHGMDVLPYDGVDYGSAGNSLGGPDEDRKHLLSVPETGWCMFSIDVRNTYGLPFDVTFDRKQDGA
ncbi:hypothetical protein HWV62_5913 [Athelia sp. TMB]|nr:hypothetical protein HWV62_5913 [Athelia sp. TMB]